MIRKFIYDKNLKKVVEVKDKPKSSGGLTIIPDEPEFVSRNAFPEVVKWTGRRSRKKIMKQYGCVDARDTAGIGKERLKIIQARREAYKQDPMVKTNIDLIKEKTPMERKETRRKYFFTGR